MVALRIVVISVAVVTLDIGVIFFGVGDPDQGWGKVWRAVDAQYDHPSAENQRALQAAQQQYEDAQRPRRAIVMLSLVLVTGGGVFLIVREFRRRRIYALSKRSPIATQTI
jgi:hypothetical protein